MERSVRLASRFVESVECDDCYFHTLASYARFLAIATNAIPMMKSGIEIQSVPASATLFRFRIASTAAATTNRIPINRRVLADRFRPPSDRSGDILEIWVIVSCIVSFCIQMIPHSIDNG